MPIPFHTHLIDVLDLDVAQSDDEPYGDDTEATRTVSSSNVRAVLSRAVSGAEIMQGGEQSSVYRRFKCDEVPLTHTSWVRDTADGTVYRVVWVDHRTVLGMKYVTGQLRLVEGLP
ncbi:MAG TPA: hypothetical protein VE326_11500 [Candidatus Binatia bacterium]|nr:hypothetical protein [Candidatus Binatia bacterium]